MLVLVLVLPSAAMTLGGRWTAGVGLPPPEFVLESWHGHKACICLAKALGIGCLFVKVHYVNLVYM